MGQAFTGNLQKSLNAFVRQYGAVELNSATVVSGTLQGSAVPGYLKGVQSPYIHQLVATSARPAVAIPGSGK